MHPKRFTDWPYPVPLYGVQLTRAAESAALGPSPTDTLMRLAGETVGRWARALYPHASRIWLLCGPGHNGVDGLWAAVHLKKIAQATNTDHKIWVTLVLEGRPVDEPMATALKRAGEMGIGFTDQPDESPDIVIDALLGLGGDCRPGSPLTDWIKRLCRLDRIPVLCVDVPSGLSAETGQLHLAETDRPTGPLGPRHTLSLLTLKPGLFTGEGREWSGDIWHDDLSITAELTSPDAWLWGKPVGAADRRLRHNAHKGTFGNVVVIGGQHIAVLGQGMTGAAILAARAALRCGAGRVWVGLMGEDWAHQPSLDALYPELMLHTASSLLESQRLADSVMVCGCGAGGGVALTLPTLLTQGPRLVLDADALNAVATHPELLALLRNRRAHGWHTVLSPHPLEAARLLSCGVDEIQRDRLLSAQRLAEACNSVVVLKGSGTVVAAPGRTPCINATGNALLATAGTGDVLAGMLGGLWAQAPFDASQTETDEALWNACLQAVSWHGTIADEWPGRHIGASGLISQINPAQSGRLAATPATPAPTSPPRR